MNPHPYTILPDWSTPDGTIALYKRDALEVLASLPSDYADALITDPPYSSGAWVRSDRNQTPGQKYQQQGTERSYPTFSGDSRSQLGWEYWSALWLSQAYRIVRDGGYAMTFTDWRQLRNCK